MTTLELYANMKLASAQLQKDLDALNKGISNFESRLINDDHNGIENCIGDLAPKLHNIKNEVTGAISDIISYMVANADVTSPTTKEVEMFSNSGYGYVIELVDGKYLAHYIKDPYNGVRNSVDGKSFEKHIIEHSGDLCYEDMVNSLLKRKSN